MSYIRIPQKSEIEETLRQRHTEEVRKRLWDSRVSIAGLGGLGSNTAVSLARAGVGHLHIVDYDFVELSNLNRQAYFFRHLGMKKTDALKELIAEINPYIDVRLDDIRIDEENAAKVFADADVLCEAFDDAESKAMLINTVLAESEKTVVVSGSGMAGYYDSNLIRTRKISDRFYLCGDGQHGIEDGGTLMAPRVSICAGHEANLVLRLLIGM